MDKIIKVLKIILLLVAIIIGIGIIGAGFVVYKGIKSGDLKSYAVNTAIETLAPNNSLTPSQQQMLESGDYSGLVEDLGDNISQEQIDCAIEVLGEDRARELTITQDPTPQEILKLSKCL